MSEPLRIVLEAGMQDAEITIRVPHARDELVEALEAEGLPASRVAEFSAASTFEVLSTSLATLGGAGAVFVGVRSVPKAAWEALGKALTAWSTRHGGPRVEYEFVDGRKLVVENNARAVRRALDEAILPEVRDQQIARHDHWRHMIGEPTDGEPAETDPPAGEGDEAS